MVIKLMCSIRASCRSVITVGMAGIAYLMVQFLHRPLCILFVARYYLTQARSCGLMGRGSLGVFRERLWTVLALRSELKGKPLWIHAAGPGDARAALVLLKHLRKEAPDLPLLVTCGTTSCRTFLEDRLAILRDNYSLFWFPFDLRCTLLRFLRVHAPLAFVGMQGEVWPLLLTLLRKRRVPAAILRMDTVDWNTQAEFPNWLRPLYENLLSNVDLFSVPAPVHAERLVELQVKPCLIHVGGDYRIDALPKQDDSRAEYFCNLLLGQSFASLVVLAGPRLDEVRAMLPLLLGNSGLHRTRFLISPVEKTEARRIENLLSKSGIDFVHRSQLDAHRSTARMVVLDSHGELFSIFGVSELAIIGDTFPPTFSEGRNLLEPLRQGAAALAGPSLPSYPHLASLESSGAILRISQISQIAPCLESFLRIKPSRDHVRQLLACALEGAPSAAARDAALVLRLLGSLATASAGSTRPALGTGPL